MSNKKRKIPTIVDDPFNDLFEKTELTTKTLEPEFQGISEEVLEKVQEQFGAHSDEETGERFNGEEDFDEENIKSLKFSDDVKILLVNPPEFRLVCHFLNANTVKDIESAPYKHVTLIGHLVQQSLLAFMKQKGYSFSGEINFYDGTPTPVVKQTWNLNNKNYVFTSVGFLFFEAKNQKDNVVAYCWVDSAAGLAGVTIHSTSAAKAKVLLTELETYTKNNNCLRGSKLRDINVYSSTFSEVNYNKNHNWDNYYYPEEIKQMFELEVFGFLNNTKRYNDVGIYKRGLILYGAPGTGKTTIGNILCNEAPNSTVIWITPDLLQENNAGKHSIKVLYLLADFLSPTVIFLEDLDLFGEDRDGTRGDIPLGALMNVLDGVNQIKNAITIATTNRLELIERALSNRPGRFDRVVEIPVLPKKLRARMFSDRFSDCKLDSGVIDEIVGLTDKWTGAECQEFINSTNLLLIQRNSEKDRHITLEVVSVVSKMITSLSKKAMTRETAGFKPS